MEICLKIQSAPSWVQPYYRFPDEFIIDDEIVIRGTKIIVPASLRRDYIE